MFWVFAFAVPKNCETDLKRDSFFWQNWWWNCDFVNGLVNYWEGFWVWFLVWYVYNMLCQAVNEQCLTLDFVRIFVLVYQLGSVSCDLCVCLCVCAVVCLCKLCDGILMFPHDGYYRWPSRLISWLVWLVCGLSITNQVSVLNQRLPKYGI